MLNMLKLRFSMLNHSGLVTPYDDMDLGEHRLKCCRACLFSKSSLARLQEFWNSSICLYEIKRKNPLALLVVLLALGHRAVGKGEPWCWLLDGTKPLPESMLIYHQRCSPAFNWEKYHSEYWSYYSLYKEFENYTFEVTAMSPKHQWVKRVHLPLVFRVYWEICTFYSTVTSSHNTFP